MASGTPVGNSPQVASAWGVPGLQGFSKAGFPSGSPVNRWVAGLSLAGGQRQLRIGRLPWNTPFHCPEIYGFTG